MRFTEKQYEEAIKNLQLAKAQLVPDGNNCSICEDGGHMAWECGHNPLLAVVLCNDVADLSENLHETLHILAGYDSMLGVPIGPAAIHRPQPEFPDTASSELD